MEDYIEINKKAYDRLAVEYGRRSMSNIAQQEQAIKPFEEMLRLRFNDPISVIDLGCGAGVSCKILADHGFKTFGLDNAPRMIKIAKEISPKTKFYETNFLNPRSSKKYEGLILGAFLNLFPANVSDKALRRLNTMLADRGLMLIYTKLYHQSQEGYHVKHNYPGSVRRFVKFYQKNEFMDNLSKYFILEKEYRGYNDEQWMFYILSKKPSNK